MKQVFLGLWLVGSISVLELGISNPTIAQIIPDATLPNNSVVIPGNTSLIEGGTKAGTNLFHSFSEFSISSGSAAFFNNAADIQNIISRVTGGAISNIDGLIRANGSANLFLVNPNGIIFGENAQLNIGGSFLATSANSVIFSDRIQFSATPQPTPSLLTVSVPVGLQLAGNNGEIIVQGSGHNLKVDRTEAVIRSNRPVGLQVQPGKTLALVGGDITLTGGNVTATEGRIELGSVKAAAPIFVSINPTANGFTLGYDGISTFGDIQLSNAASADASGAGGGDIQVQGRRVSLRDGSAILAITEADKPGGSLLVNASESVELIGTTANGKFKSGLLTQTQGEGAAGNLQIETARLIVQGGQASASTFSAGAGGNLTVRASESVELAGSAADTKFLSGLFTLVDKDATGNGGNLTIETGRLVVQQGAQVATTTFGDGLAGNLTVRARESVELAGSTADGKFASGLYAQSEGNQNSGDLTIETERLILRKGAEISNNTYGAGDAGNLLIRASDSVKVSGTRSVIAAQVDRKATGNGGNLTIETTDLTVRNGRVSAATLGAGSAGNLTVNASESVQLNGVKANANNGSGLFATTQGSGAGGNLQINTRELTVRDGAQVTAATLGGKGGTVTVNASDFVELRGSSANGEVNSGLFARTRGAGDAGNLRISTGQLLIRDGAQATVSSNLGRGAAGNLEVEAGSILLDNGVITADTASGDRGNITLQSENIILRRESAIATNATGTATGGNINIDTDTLVAIENSDITANSVASFGGRVQIRAQGIFGIEARQELTPESDITATSQLGAEFDGVVDLQIANVNPTQGLVALSPNVAPPPLPQGCNVASSPNASRFVTTGFGGVPQSPSDALSSEAFWDDFRPLQVVNSAVSPTIPKLSRRTPVRIVEAQGLVMNAEGRLILTEQPPTGTPHSPWLSPTGCQSKR